MSEKLSALLTPEQVADYLQLPVHDVMELLASGEMPGSRLVNKWRIRKEKLDEWIDSQSITATSWGKQSTESENSPSLVFGEISESKDIDLTNDLDKLIISNNSSEIESEIKTELETFENTKSEKNSTDPENSQTLILGTSYESKDVSLIDVSSQSTIISNNSETEIKTEPETSVIAKPTELKQPHSSQDLKNKPKWTPPIQPSEGKEKRFRGTVTMFKLKDGFGFIKGEDGRTFYVRSIDIAGWGQSLRRNEKVEFDAIKVPQGWTAKNVVILSNKSSLLLSEGSSSAQQVSSEALSFYTEALVAREEKDWNRAKRLFEQAIQFGPVLNAFQAYAAMEEKTNRVDSALNILERGILAFPSFGALYNDKAMLLRKRKKLQDAIETLQEGLKFAPDFS